MQTVRETMAAVIPFGSISMPFDIVEMKGEESADFLQRISTNDLSTFVPDSMTFTLLVSDKGRIIDTVWLVHRGEYLLLLLSHGTAASTIGWLNRYIIMEEIVLTDVTSRYSVSIHSDAEKGPYCTEYFGFPVSFSIDGPTVESDMHSGDFEQWRILQGIPKIGHEIVEEFNPLELNLWNWISFTKGCYIGQEVIARLDTYNKVQRSLCLFRTAAMLQERAILCDSSGNDLGKITSVFNDGTAVIGLAMIRTAAALSGSSFHLKGTDLTVSITKVFRKG
jgi:folate-binding protein YgfZ